MGWFFHKKSTDYSQDIHSLRLDLERFSTKIESLEGSIRLIQVEVADYHEKTRRLYLRLNKRERDDSEETSAPKEEPVSLSTTAQREKILRDYKAGR